MGTKSSKPLIQSYGRNQHRNGKQIERFDQFDTIPSTDNQYGSQLLWLILAIIIIACMFMYYNKQKTNIY